MSVSAAFGVKKLAIRAAPGEILQTLRSPPEPNKNRHHLVEFFVYVCGVARRSAGVDNRLHLDDVAAALGRPQRRYQYVRQRAGVVTCTQLAHCARRYQVGN